MKEEKIAVLRKREGRAPISPDEFIAEMEGFTKEGSSCPR